MSMSKEIVMALVKPGDTLEITPHDKLPNFDRKIKVQSITKDGYIYNMTDRYDGDLYPFWAIKDLKIVKGE